MKQLQPERFLSQRTACYCYWGYTAYHFLHSDREGNLQVLEALVHAVGDGAVSEERGQHALASSLQGLCVHIAQTKAFYLIITCLCRLNHKVLHV